MAELTETCSISEDGRHVIPCRHLGEQTEFGNPQRGKRGMYCWQFWNRAKRGTQRTLFGVVTSEAPKGVVFNFCPFCGTDISKPSEPT